MSSRQDAGLQCDHRPSTREERRMASVLNPYISFDGNAREALETYHGIFGGDLALNTFGEYGQADTPVADKIMHGQLTAPNGMTLMCADTPPEMKHEPGNNIAISLSGTD